MGRTKFAAILAATLPIGAAFDMMPKTEPIKFGGIKLCRTIIPEVYGIPGMNKVRDADRSEIAPASVGRKSVHRNRNILSSTKPIR